MRRSIVGFWRLGVRCVEVDRSTTAKRAWRCVADMETSQVRCQARPVDELKGSDGIPNPPREWPSPTDVGQNNSLVVWNWLICVSGQFRAEGISSVPAISPRLVLKHQLLLRTNSDLGFIFLCTGEWGVITANVSSVGESGLSCWEDGAVVSLDGAGLGGRGIVTDVAGPLLNLVGRALREWRHLQV